MKLKELLFVVMLFVLPLNLFSQTDSIDFFDLKLVSDRLTICEDKGNITKSKTIKLPDTYFFFTNYGVYGADEYGILKYEFVSPLEINKRPSTNINRFEIKAIDTELNKNCVFVLFDYYQKEKYRVFIVYDVKQFMFECKSIE